MADVRTSEVLLVGVYTNVIVITKKRVSADTKMTVSRQDCDLKGD
jgi:hypothetical protein